MTTNQEAVNAMPVQPTDITAQPQAANAAGLTPTAAWSRRVRRIGGLIQAAFAAFLLARASLAIGGRAGDVLIAMSGVAVISVFAYAIRVTAGTAPHPVGPQAGRIERSVSSLAVTTPPSPPASSSWVPPQPASTTWQAWGLTHPSPRQGR